jgi:diguanylate cyclase (GGDEF)-like protein/PAS domain S-box-containing protein
MLVRKLKTISGGFAPPRDPDAALLADSVAPFDEKERAQVTLDSIANGIISSNFRGRVTFLNPIAEAITGWSSAEARGRHLDEILCLVNPASRDRIPCLGMRAIIEGRAVALETPAVLIRRDGAEADVEHSASPIRDKTGAVIGTVLVLHDVTLVREQVQMLARLALYDALTGLPNRTLLMDRLERALERARRSRTLVSVLFIDLDRFKPVNDSLGHAAGDQLLTLVGQRLLKCVRKSDTVSRLGGDEFVVVMEDIHQSSEADRCARKIAASITRPFDLGGHIVNLGASVGVATFPEDAGDASELLREADRAMYREKSTGRKKLEAVEGTGQRRRDAARREAIRARR